MRAGAVGVEVVDQVDQGVEAERGVVAAVDAEPHDRYVASGSGVGSGRDSGSGGEQ